MIGGSFYLNDHKHVLFEPATCRLSRLTAREARRFAAMSRILTTKDQMSLTNHVSWLFCSCLKDKHVVFIGMSFCITFDG